jgi:hypothetical protein
MQNPTPKMEGGKKAKGKKVKGKSEAETALIKSNKSWFLLTFTFLLYLLPYFVLMRDE